MSQSSRKPVILVVDDTEASRYALARYLRRAGYQVWEAATGEEGLRLLDKKPRLVILDVHLPDVLGYDVCRTIKTNPDTRNIPVLQISATFTMSADKVKGLESGADGYLTGPVQPDELLANVRLLLRLEESQESLRRTNERLNSILASITEAYFAIDDQWRFLTVNRAAEQAFEKTAAQLRGTVFWDEFPRARHTAAGTAFSEAMVNRRSVHCESQLGAGDRWYEVHAYPGTEGLEVYARDITERRLARQRLEESERQLRELNAQLEQKVTERTARLRETVTELEHFSYSITHDMRAPLRAMQGFGQLLRPEVEARLGREYQDYLQRIITAAERMDALVRDALNYSKLVRQEVPLVPVRVEPLLRGIIDSYPDLQPPRAEVRIESGIPPVLGNEAWLTQCFSCLLDNAVKFVPPGRHPRVRIWSESADDRVRLWFEDNGIGIQSEYHEVIFKMFQRLNPDYEGTGIGLAIVRKVVEQMGGKVGVDSVPEQGSRFWILLQAAPEAAPASPARPLMAARPP